MSSRNFKPAQLNNLAVPSGWFAAVESDDPLPFVCKLLYNSTNAVATVTIRTAANQNDVDIPIGPYQLLQGDFTHIINIAGDGITLFMSCHGDRRVAKPTLTIVSTSETTASFTWTNPPGTVISRVYQSLTPEGPYTMVLETAGESGDSTGLEPDTTYYWYLVCSSATASARSTTRTDATVGPAEPTPP